MKYLIMHGGLVRPVDVLPALRMMSRRERRAWERMASYDLHSRKVWHNIERRAERQARRAAKLGEPRVVNQYHRPSTLPVLKRQHYRVG